MMTATPGIPTALEGREFWSTWVTIGGESKELIDNTRVVLRFNGNQIGASAGCKLDGRHIQTQGIDADGYQPVHDRDGL